MAHDFGVCAHGSHGCIALACVCAAQRFFGTAVGKGRQAAKTEIERLKLDELSCEQGVTEVAKMCGAHPAASVAFGPMIRGGGLPCMLLQ